MMIWRAVALLTFVLSLSAYSKHDLSKPYEVEEVPLTHSSWIAARAIGPWHRMVLNDIQTFAHTSPVYIEVAGQPVSRAASARWLLDWLDRFEALLRTQGQFADEAQRDEVIAIIARARPYYQAHTR